MWGGGCVSRSVVSDSLRPPRTVAHQAPLSMRFPRQEYGVGRHSLFLPNPGIEPVIPALQVDSLPSEPPGKLTTTQIKLWNFASMWNFAMDVTMGKYSFMFGFFQNNSVFEIHLLYFRNFFFFSWLCTILIYEYATVYSIIFLWMDSWVAYNLGLMLLWRLMWIFLSVVNICTRVSWAIYTSWGSAERSVICKVYSVCKDIASPNAILPVSGCLACLLF